ncbi:ATP-binding cassette domain-containing protein [Oricola sp.]|uniref:ATP-binding cassette domain-containing protein n=1 Tax=Oricola sp. TaxID=1979950 RepID=UPI0025F84FFC|nr:ATP-binding cassette domain-containing protein [Oricola sp.]MCI5074051.1 ATP-binding cassette domain-containing protein [Oricola sp.]
MRSLIERWSHELAIAGIAFIAVIVFGLIEPRYLLPGNLIDIVRQTAVIAILAFAMTAVIAARGIDMSMGGILALSGMVLGIILSATGSEVLAILGAIATGCAVGLVNGVITGVFGINAFLSTFAMLAVMRAGALMVNESSSIRVQGPFVLWTGQGELLGVPVSIVVMAFMCALWIFLLGRMRLGRWIFAVGNSPSAAVASLLPVPTIIMSTYVLSGLSAGIGAVVTVGRLGSAQPLAGAGIEFAALTAAIIGGARLNGGRGSIIGTFLGAILLGLLGTGLSFMQISQQMTYVVTGTMVILAVLIADPAFRNRLLRVAGPLAGRDRAGHGEAAASPGIAQRSGSQDPVVEGKLDAVVRVRGLSKSYGAIQALSKVDLNIRPGKVLALLGENGAGKSTLVKCLGGTVRCDAGELLGRGGASSLRDRSDGADCAIVHQHFSLVPDLSLVDNLVAVRGAGFSAFGQRKRLREKLNEIRSEFGLDVDASVPVRELTVGQRQIAEIIKAIIEDKWLIIMDEPTSALTVAEREALFKVIAELKSRGKAVIYISHKLDEIFEVAEHIAVLRDGKLVGEVTTAETDAAELIRMMVGRQIDAVFPHVEAATSDVALLVEDLCDGNILASASFDVKKGEILGIVGLMGSGRTELLRCIAGLSGRTAGSVTAGGQHIAPADPLGGRAAGIGYVPEDRLKDGIFADLSIGANLTLCRLSNLGVAPRPAMLRSIASDWIDRLDVRPRNPLMRVGDLSGGNQQKVVLGRYLAMSPTVLLLDEPTQGVDVGAKSEIHRLIGELKKTGAAIVIVSSELPEVLGVADRILVMSAGRSYGPVPRGTTPETIMAMALAGLNR